MLFLAALFTVGTAYFAILCCAVVIALICFTEYVRPGWATFTLIALFALNCVIKGVDPRSYFTDPAVVAEIIGAYLAVGIPYAFARWWRFVKVRSAVYDKVRVLFLEKNKLPALTDGRPTQMPDALLDAWQDATRHGILVGNQHYTRFDKPFARDHKDRILMWAAYWPTSMLWTLINDPVKRFFKELWRLTHKSFQRVSDRAYDGKQDDFREAPKPPAGGRGGNPQVDPLYRDFRRGPDGGR